MDRKAGTASLSRRELQIARAYAAGSGYRDIADQLFIAPSTVRTHLSTIYRKLGVSSKVDLLRVLEGSQEASRRLRYSAHEKPSIAVLPFANMSVDPDQEYFSDGITEDLITDLSKLPNISVIARNSTFTFKGQAVNVVEAGRRLGARYVVEGSVRRAGNRLRITAQLIEAETGHHLWAERYERELTDVFAVQDEVKREIVAALQVRFTRQQAGQLKARGTANLQAYELLLRGREFYYLFTPDANARAAELFSQAIEADPDYAEAYGQLGRTHLTSWNLGWDRSVEHTLDRALECSLKAVALDRLLPQGHALLSHVYVWKREHEKAITSAERAVQLDPNHADAHAFRAAALCWSGRAKEGVPAIEQAMKLNPVYPGWYLFFFGMAHFEMRLYAEAIDGFRRAIVRTPDFLQIISSLPQHWPPVIVLPKRRQKLRQR